MRLGSAQLVQPVQVVDTIPNKATTCPERRCRPPSHNAFGIRLEYFEQGCLTNITAV